MVYRKRKSYPKKRRVIRKKRTVRKRTSSGAVNTAALRENYSMSLSDGTMNFFRNVELADASYDRAQAVAAAFQEYKIKYVKLIFRPSADTFAPAAGNTIPQLYFQMDKSNAVPTTASLQTLQDMGCRPIRFDARNITKTYRPTVLTADMVSPGAVVASQTRTSPWLSTNANSGNPGAGWAPSAVDHLGCLFHVTQMNPMTPPVNFKVDVEVVFCFRKPLWRGGSSETPGALIINGQPTPILSASAV